MHHPEQQPSKEEKKGVPNELTNLYAIDRELRKTFNVGRKYRTQLYQNVGKALEDIDGYSSLTGFASPGYPYINGVSELLVTQVEVATNNSLPNELRKYNQYVIALQAWQRYLGNYNAVHPTVTNQLNKWNRDYWQFWLPRAYNYAEYYLSEIDQLKVLLPLVTEIYDNEQRVHNDNYPDWHIMSEGYEGSQQNLDDLGQAVSRLFEQLPKPKPTSRNTS